MSAEHAAVGERYCPSCEQTFAALDRCPNDNTRLVKLDAGTDQLIGRALDNRYTITERIGHGGMGTVYRGTQHSVGRDVAIKVVNPALVTDATAIKRFLREAKLASRLSHPNAVSVLDFGQTDDNLFYLVMELVVGDTLDKLLERERTLAPARVVRIGTQICDALEAAHKLQIVHRDLKPANVMLLDGTRDFAKVLDFGLAKSLSPDASSATMTNANALLGTPAFIPPELVLGEPCDSRGDLYSLGCVLYAAAAGRLPFTADSIHELIAMHASEPPPPLTNVPRGVAQVIERLLAKSPADRYQTAAKARDALEASITINEPVHKTVLGWSGEIAPPPPRRNTPVSGIARTRTGEQGKLPRTGEQGKLPRTGEQAKLASSPAPPPDEDAALPTMIDLGVPTGRATTNEPTLLHVGNSPQTTTESDLAGPASRTRWIVLALVTLLALGGVVALATRGGATSGAPAAAPAASSAPAPAAAAAGVAVPAAAAVPAAVAVPAGVAVPAAVAVPVPVPVPVPAAVAVPVPVPVAVPAAAAVPVPAPVPAAVPVPVPASVPVPAAVPTPTHAPAKHTPSTAERALTRALPDEPKPPQPKPTAQPMVHGNPGVGAD